MVDWRSAVTFLFLVKWIIWYLSGANLAPNLFAHPIHLSCAVVNRLQLDSAESPHVTRVVSSTNPNPSTLSLTSWNCCNRSEMKKMNSAGDRVEPCGMPVSVSNQRDPHAVVDRPTRAEVLGYICYVWPPLCDHRLLDREVSEPGWVS